MNNQLSPQTTEHKKDHDILQTWHWDRHKNVVGLNQLMGSQSSSPDNLVSKKNAVINRIKNCTCFLFAVIYISVDRDRCMWVLTLLSTIFLFISRHSDFFGRGNCRKPITHSKLLTILSWNQTYKFSGDRPLIALVDVIPTSILRLNQYKKLN